MAVHNKQRPPQTAVHPRRTNIAPTPAPGHGKVRVGSPIGERRAQAAQPAVARKTQARSILQSARDIFAGRNSAKIQHSANARYVTGHPKAPLHAVTKETAATEGLIPHQRAMAFLDHFLAQPGKVRSKV